MKRQDNGISSEFIREITAVQSAIAAYIRALLPAYPDYMDILQEVNVTLWRKQDDYRPGSNFKAWAFKVAHYHVLTTRRKLAVEGTRLVFDSDLIQVLAEAASHRDESMERKLSALQLCLGELREKDRDLLRMRYSSTGSIEDYASQHQRNAGTVRATLRRLREMLLKCVTTKLRSDIFPPEADPA